MLPLALEFLAPGRLWALLVIPAIAVLYVFLSGRRTKANVSNRLKLVIPKDAAWKRHGAVLLALLSLASLILAWAMPKDYANVPRDRASVVVVIDVSWSMEATDVEPNRLLAAKDSAKQFVMNLPERFNVALVSFAGTANVAVPPTTDRGAVTRAIEALQMAPSTATGEGIYASLEALKMVPPNPDDPDSVPPAAIVLLADGATNMGRASAGAAEQAKQQGVPIYTIAYGTQDGWVESNGQRQRVAVDHYELSEIAKRSGGKKFSAETASQLREIYEAIRSDIGYEKVPMEVTDRYAGLAIIFAIAAALGVISLGARWP
ncbi:VWA domain-containing protein [Tessaracoccus sp. OS52]|nr:VWA domain-containing protein [Tessaracoccus sp. OS52]MCC2592744.1 VWA domain-containing protein [Tessaracoccus sp. OS52]